MENAQEEGDKLSGYVSRRCIDSAASNIFLLGPCSKLYTEIEKARQKETDRQKDRQRRDMRKEEAHMSEQGENDDDTKKRFLFTRF